MQKRYYWLKLKEDFFNSPHLKAMRNLPGGIELCVIYLKMMLLSIKNNGNLLHTLASNSFADELSLLLDENSNSIEMVLHFLNINHLIEQVEDNSYLLPEAQKCIGSESVSAEKMRKKREKDAEIKYLQNGEKSQCDQNVTGSQCDAYIDTDTDIDTTYNSTKNIKNFNINNNEELVAVVAALEKIDINKNVAVELYAKYGKETILLALKDMQNRKGIIRPGGYLIRMLQENWPISPKLINEEKEKKHHEEIEKLKKICSQCNKNELCNHQGGLYQSNENNKIITIQCPYCINKDK